MNQDQKENTYASIRQARALKKALVPSKANPKTKAEYELVFTRLLATCSPKTPEGYFAAMSNTCSKRTYYKRLAAVRHVIQEGLQSTLQEQDRQQIAGNLDAWLKSVKKLDFLVTLHCILETHEGACPLAHPAPRRSKRRTLRSLPTDFREQMYSATASSKYRLAYLASVLTGCRPEELEYGIRIWERDGQLILHVIGAKVVDGEQGQAWREIGYPAESEHSLVQALLSELRSAGAAELLVAVESKVAWTSHLRRIGRKLWPRIRSETTGYTLRHMAASDWKAAGLSEDEVSMALGHAVSRTSSFYGQRQIARGAGMLQPASVRAATAVKQTRTARPHTSRTARHA